MRATHSSHSLPLRDEAMKTAAKILFWTWLSSRWLWYLFDYLIIGLQVDLICVELLSMVLNTFNEMSFGLIDIKLGLVYARILEDVVLNLGKGWLEVDLDFGNWKLLIVENSWTMQILI